MIKRYICGKQAIELLGKQTVDAFELLKEPVIVENEDLHTKHLRYCSLTLSDEQAAQVRNAGIYIQQQQQMPFIECAGDYEKVRSRYYAKERKRNLTGKGCKVAVIDTGCVVAVQPVDFAFNLVDGTTNVSADASHGTAVVSVIKNATIGLAPDCELHLLKVTSGSVYDMTAILAALDYCIDNSIHIINMSFNSLVDPPFFDSLDDCYAAGISLVAAAGNSPTVAATAYPATLENVVAVNAVKENGDPGAFNVLPEGSRPTNHGITVACSGISCEVLFTNGSFGNSSGSSFSSPFFAGAFALEYERSYHKQPHRIEEELLRRCNKQVSTLHFGNGWLNF